MVVIVFLIESNLKYFLKRYYRAILIMAFLYAIIKKILKLIQKKRDLDIDSVIVRVRGGKKRDEKRVCY